MAELLSAMDVDRERDPAGAAAARRRFSLLLTAITVLMGGAAFVKNRPLRLSMGELTMVMGLVVLMFSSVVIFFRKTLFSNAFHRGLTLVTLINMSTLFLIRAMAWNLGIPILQYYPMDLLSLGGSCALLSLMFLPRLWVVLPAMLAAAMSCARWPQHGHIIANLIYTLVPLIFIYGWYLVSTMPKRDGK
jgi:hypothetical protein